MGVNVHHAYQSLEALLDGGCQSHQKVVITVFYFYFHWDSCQQLPWSQWEPLIGVGRGNWCLHKFWRHGPGLQTDQCSLFGLFSGRLIWWLQKSWVKIHLSLMGWWSYSTSLLFDTSMECTELSREGCIVAAIILWFLKECSRFDFPSM